MWVKRNGVVRVAAYGWFQSGRLPVAAQRVARVTAWATTDRIPVDEVVTEVGSALNGHRRKFLGLLRDPSVARIVVEHWDRFCRFGSEYVEAALGAPGLVCAGLYGKRAAANRAQRAMTAAAVGDGEAA